MKTRKTLWHRFDISAFDEELGLLNEMSEKGWQLADMRTFTQKYVWDDSVVYRYAIDYQEEMSMGEFNQYRAEFEEAGWRYVSTVRPSGWYVFRRPYDPALPEEAFLLYTDEPSFRQMKRATVIGINLAWLVWLPDFLIFPDPTSILITLAWVLSLVHSIRRRLRFKRVRRAPKPYRSHLWRYFYILLSMLFLLAFAIIFVERDARDFTLEGETAGVQSGEFTVRIPDFFALRTWTDAQEARPPAFTLTRADGGIADSGVLDPHGERRNEWLRPGAYTLTVDWGDGGEGSYTVSLGNISLLPEMPEIPLLYRLLWIFGVLAAATAVDVVMKRRERRQ